MDSKINSKNLRQMQRRWSIKTKEVYKRLNKLNTRMLVCLISSKRRMMKSELSKMNKKIDYVIRQPTKRSWNKSWLGTSVT